MADPDPAPIPQDRFRRLLEVGSALVAELDLEAVLQAVVEAARDLTGARYAALGVLDREGRELERFIHLGVDAETAREIGGLPRGRGVLGELIREPAPLRLRDVERHPHAYGFPPGHPPMHSFLGVPVSVRGETFGNLYLTEKRGAEEFDEGDQDAVLTLATWAGIAIENARLYTALSEREAEVERALRQAETSADIARTVGGETDVDRVLELIVKRARALVEARALLVLLRRGEDLFVAAAAGEAGPELRGTAVQVEGSVYATVLGERQTAVLRRDTPAAPGGMRERLGAETALAVPLLFRGRAVGILLALDREAGGAEFDEEDRELLQAFASSAASAVATAQSVEAERLHQQVEVAERERQRWAQELHDDALQGLAAIRISLAAALQRRDEERAAAIEATAAETVAGLEHQIDELTRLVNDLRPAALERLGLAGGLESLARECGARGGLAVRAAVALESVPLNRREERAVYRFVQEALNNVAKHAGASRVELDVEAAGGELRIEVADDGRGFDPETVRRGHGLDGMRERVEGLGGRLELTAGPGAGTRLRAVVPLSRRP